MGKIRIEHEIPEQERLLFVRFSLSIIGRYLLGRTDSQREVCSHLLRVVSFF